MTSSVQLRTVVGSEHGAGRAGIRRKLAVLAVVSLACLLTLAPRSGAAGEFARGDSLSSLREFAEARGIAPAEEAAKGPLQFGAPAADRDNRAYLDLRDFVDRIGEGAPPVVRTKGEKTKTIVKAEGEATYVGAQVCLTCHAAQAASFGVTLMGKIFRNPRNAQERANCETCHGPGSLHVKAGGGRGVGGIISFRLDDQSHTPDEFNAICLSCHEKGNRVLWRGSTHETRGLACTNCHTIMTNVTPKHQLSQLTEMDTCFQCHKNKRAEIWRTSHMPLREGKMTCSNCHNPHGSYGESLLKEATVNDNCYKCHAEKRGPFLWEHAPVRENCLNCHDPHGSNNDFLLKISRPRLCQQCHATLVGHPGNPRNPKSIYAINRECQNCHSRHHGSNSPAGSRFIR